MDELCALLLVGATFSSDVVTLRERYQSNLQLELEELQEKVKAVDLLMAENSSGGAANSTREGLILNSLI